MTSLPPDSDANRKNNAAAAAGMTFIDNSDLSVCEKIKLYFAKNNKPAYQALISPTSSAASTSPDLDASFKHMLEESRRRKLNKSRTVAAQFKFREFDTDLLMDDSTIDLCSSPESVEDAVYRLEADVSPNLSAFNGTLFGAQDSRQRAASRQLRLSKGAGYESDDSLGVAELNDTFADKKEELPWYMERSDSDNSFLEHERECQREAEELERMLNVSCGNETHLFDTEAPSMLWDQSVANETLAMFPMSKTNAFRSRPSTIAEESTINSSSASSLVSASSVVSQRSNIPTEQKSKSYRESSMNVFPKKFAERSFALDRPKPATSKESAFNDFPKRTEVSMAPKQATDIFKPSTTYRESSMNVFPKKHSPARLEPSSSLPSKPNPANVLSPKQINTKPQALTPTPLLSASASLHNTRKSSPKPPIKPKPSSVVSPHRKSLALMSFDETLGGDENYSFDEDNDTLNTARQFNDTIEAMDFYMDKGHKLLQSAVKKPPPSSKSNSPSSSSSPSSVSPNLMHFSPKNVRNTPDTIRRRLLMRNLLRNSDALSLDTANDHPSSAVGGPQFSHAEMMLRRSIRRMNDSFED